MSLVLNGGVGGTGSTQGAYIDSVIASNLPLAMAVCWRAGENSSSAGALMRMCQSVVDTLNTYNFGGNASRAVGPIITQSVGGRGTTASFATSLTNAAYVYDIQVIAVGETTMLTVPGHNFQVGEMVRLTGTLTGITGILDGRDYKVLTVSSSLVELQAATSGEWQVGSTATARRSAWQPNVWNMTLLTFGASGTSDSHRNRAGLVGEAGLMVMHQHSGIAGQRGFELWSVVDRFCLGCLYQNDTLQSPFRGEMAHAALFAPTLTDTSEAAALLGARPDAVALPLLAYWPLTSNLNDVVGSNHLIPLGNPSVTSDDPFPPVEGGQLAALAAYYEMLRRVR
jgi:hypothetical protein